MATLRPDFYQASTLAFHSRLTSIALWFLLALVTSVLLAIQFSARQPATIALDIGLSVIRLIMPLLVVLLSQELISREFERKLYLASLTYPRPRAQWLLGRVAAIVSISSGLLLILGAVLAGLTHYASSSYPQSTPVTLGLPYMVTLAFVALDLLVAVAIATLLAIAATSASFVLIGTIGFVLIARSYTPIIELLRKSPYVVDQFSDPRIYQDSLGLLAFILPDLGRIDVRMIALYDKMEFLPPDWLLLVGATLAYVIALVALSTWVLNRREFG